MELTNQTIDSLIATYQQTNNTKLKPEVIELLKSDKGKKFLTDFLKLNNDLMFAINIAALIYKPNSKFNLPSKQQKEKTMFNEITMFEQTQIKFIYDENGEKYITMQNIGEAINHSNISKLYKENQAEFEGTDETFLPYSKGYNETLPPFTKLVVLPTAGGAQEIRVFNIKGALLLTMLARTEVAKKFRLWLLKLIDKHKDAIKINKELESNLNNCKTLLFKYAPHLLKVSNANTLNFSTIELKRALAIGDKRLRRYKKELSSIGVAAKSNRSKQLALI